VRRERPTNRENTGIFESCALAGPLRFRAGASYRQTNREGYVRGDGETDSMTQGRCENCGVLLDQAVSCGCQTTALVLAPAAASPVPTVSASAEPAPPPAVPSIPPQQSTKSEAALRFGWDPAMPDEPSPAAIEPPAEPRKTVAEAPLPAPELEALFAALEASPIRVKPSTPDPVPPVPVQDVAPEQPPVAASSIGFEAPRVFEPMPPASEVSATINLQAALNAVAWEAPREIAPPPAVEATAPAVATEPVEDTAPASIKIRMPVFDPLPPVTPANLVDVVSAEPRAATPAPVVAAMPTPANALEDAPAFAAALEAPKAVTPPPAPKPAAAPAPAPAPTPAPAARVAATASAKPSNRRSLVTAAAAVIILGAIGVPLSRLWLERTAAHPVQQLPVQQPAPQPAAPRPAPAAHTATPAATPTPTPAPTPAPAPSPAAAPRVTPPPAAAAQPHRAPSATTVVPPTAAAQVRALPAPDATARVAPKPTRPVTTPAPQAEPALTTMAPAIVTPSVTELAPAPVEPAPAPLPAEPASAPAAGPFFELNDVDRPPKVATRTAANIPASIQGQPLNEIVVVRVLVSQAGRPALVSLLRHSKAGLALDEAVIEAVKQWTFTPAVKRGQNVSCFYHVAVPVGPGR
jgi:TonB family protein